jgi:hypothetical protein
LSEDGRSPATPEEHPRGTLAIVAVFGILFLIGWLVMYFVVFAGRGHLH